jgi:hypothetical protein
VARSYSVRIAAVALGVPAKWVDNVLSQHDIPGVTSSRQGVERSISDLGIKVLEIVRIGSHELGIPVSRSVEIAVAATVAPDARFVTASGAELRFAIETIDRRLRERLVDAIEATPRLARGRPRLRV